MFLFICRLICRSGSQSDPAGWCHRHHLSFCAEQEVEDKVRSHLHAYIPDTKYTRTLMMSTYLVCLWSQESGDHYKWKWCNWRKLCIWPLWLQNRCKSSASAKIRSTCPPRIHVLKDVCIFIPRAHSMELNLTFPSSTICMSHHLT